ncbi:MAG TPA: chromosome partition protein MukE [Polyangiaceae bacterium]
METSRVIDDLGAAVTDESFPEVDLALRRGRHIDRDDSTWYAFLLDAQAVLEGFYRRFGCELVHKSDGYFYLLPVTDQLGKRQLSVPEMLVGQALALLYLDPRTVQSGGVVTRDDVLAHLAGVMGTDGLMRALNPKKRRLDERVAQETVRARVAEGLRKLASGGFIELLEGESVRLRSALMRFAEPVRGSEAPEEALAKLVAKGEVMLEPAFDSDPDGDSVFDGEPRAEPAAESAPEHAVPFDDDDDLPWDSPDPDAETTEEHE